jgi:uncharacterized membrane protein HdeD (DUF308 family)
MGSEAEAIGEIDPDPRAAVRELGRWWWLWLVIGVGWTVVSLIILEMRSSAVTTIGLVIGIMFIVAGFQELLTAAAAEGWRWLWVIFGIAFLIAGVVALVYPERTFVEFADMLGFLFLLVGTVWVIESFATRDANPLWWLGLVAGLLMLVMAFWTAGQFFFTKAYVLLVFAGIWALMHGLITIVRAFQIRRAGKLATS